MCNACIPTLNEAKQVDDFADQLLNVLNQGASALMISIGHRTGLFDGLDELGWSSEQQIAEHTGLQTRYVKEWLAAMVSAAIVQYKPHDQLYHLPQSHAALLCRRCVLLKTPAG